MKFKKYRRLLALVGAVFLMVLLGSIFFEWYIANVNNLLVDDIVATGHRYLVFGSQKTNGIELYDLKQQKLIHFLVPAEKDFIYSDPVIGASGKGFCMKHAKIFDPASGAIELISFDLNLLRYQTIGNLPMRKYEAFSLSPDETKLAIVYAISLDSPYLMGIYDIAAGRMEKTFSFDSFKTSEEILWKTDNRNVVLWSTLIDGPSAMEIDTETGKLRTLENFPLDYKGKYMIAMDSRKKSVYMQDLESGEKQVIVKDNATGHAFSLSRNGQYVIFGWLRGLGAETLTIMEAKSKRKFQLKTTEGIVLGLALW